MVYFKKYKVAWEGRFFMRRKMMAVLISVMFVILTLVGCNGETEKTSTVKEITFDEITWPGSDIAKKVPQPESTRGYIEWENKNGFALYITDMTSDQFKEYIDVCKSAGFTNNYQSGTDYYYGDLNDGTHLNLQYGNEYENTTFIRADAPDSDPEDANSDKPDSEEATQESETNGNQAQEIPETAETTEATDLNVSSDFKTTMDSYESFMNDYVDFMKKYENASDDEYLTMLQEYTEMMTQYADMTEKMNSINTSTLSPDDLAYYTAVMGRVTQKLDELN